jgi:hypothetical protein
MTPEQAENIESFLIQSYQQALDSQWLLDETMDVITNIETKMASRSTSVQTIIERLDKVLDNLKKQEKKRKSS